MVVSAAILTPLTWFGTPKDFWPIAVGALITTIVACVLIIFNIGIKNTEVDAIVYPPATANGFFQGDEYLLGVFTLKLCKISQPYEN